MHCSDEGEILYGEGPEDSFPVPNFTFMGADVWVFRPKTFKVWNFAYKFAHIR